MEGGAATPETSMHAFDFFFLSSRDGHDRAAHHHHHLIPSSVRSIQRLDPSCYFAAISSLLLLGICKVKAWSRLAGLLWGLRISPVRRSR